MIFLIQGTSGMGSFQPIKIKKEKEHKHLTLSGTQLLSKLYQHIRLTETCFAQYYRPIWSSQQEFLRDFYMYNYATFETQLLRIGSILY